MQHSIPVGRHTRRSAWLTAAGTIALSLVACQDVAAPTSNSVVDTESAAASENPHLSATAIPDEYIVVFNKDVVDVDARASALEKAHGASHRFTYTAAFKGFSAHMSAQAAEAIMNDPNVLSVESDQTALLQGTQTGAPWGLDRIDQAGFPLDGAFNYPN